jgi:tryptophan 2,3-dioxygenase
MTERKTPTYWGYIKVDELLALQSGHASSDEDLSNDEVMFITIHQIDELWFKLVLRELVAVRDLFAQPVVPEQSLASAVRGIRRMQELLVHLTAHFTLMETMTTRDYLDFRDKLGSASGFQSGQLREIEILLGLPDAERVSLGGGPGSWLEALRDPNGAPSSAFHRVQMRLADKPSLRDALREWLYRTPIQGSVPGQEGDAAAVAGFVDEYCAQHENVTRAALEARGAEPAAVRQRFDKEIAAARAFLRAEDAPADDRARASRVRAALVFIESYRELPLLAWPREVIDAVVAFEQQFVVFRQRHARMVERVIGRRTGTGGSSGVDYLDMTALKYRVFREVWAVRTLLLRKGDLPALRHPEIYGFASGHVPANGSPGGA